MEPKGKIIEELYGFKNKTNKILNVRFKKEDFILPTPFPGINQVILFDIDAPNDLKQFLIPLELF